MRIRTHLRTGFLVIFIGTLVVAVMSSEDLAWMFDPDRSEQTPYSPPRTPWGDPDLQGAYTNTDERWIPMERLVEDSPGWFERISKAITSLARRNEAQYARAAVVEWEPAFEGPPKHSRGWLVVDPPDGRIPPMTKEVSKRRAAAAERLRDASASKPWVAFGLFARCISRGMPDSMMPAIYGNVYDITQAPGVIAIRYEMINETRVIPLDGRPHVSEAFRSYMGDARGWFDGDTLVVETTNVTDKTSFRGSSDRLRLIERFTPIAADRLEWSVTLDDPMTWSSPWTFAMRLTRATHGPLEFACHEGNYALRNMLTVQASIATDKP
jgi:hypothetical protein